MSHHILVIEREPVRDPMQPEHTDERQWRIECPPDNGCSGWMECDKPHEVEGFGSAEDGPDDSEETAPWEGREEFEFHGVMHEWNRCGHGWTVPWPGCVVAGNEWASPPDGMDDLPSGRYPIEDDWDDTSVSLDLIHPIPGRCPSSSTTTGGWTRWCERPEGHAGTHHAGNYTGSPGWES